MKKFGTIFLGLLILAGCSSPEEKAEKETLNSLEEIGFTKENAQDFYNFSNSSKIIFNKMTEINNEMEDNSFVIPNDDYKTVSAAVEVAEDAYGELNPKGKADYENYFIDDDYTMSSPILILDNIEDYHRTFTLSEAAMTWDMMTLYAKNAIESSGLTDEKALKAIAWYHKNNGYDDLFKEAYDYRTKNGTKLE